MKIQRIVLRCLLTAVSLTPLAFESLQAQAVQANQHWVATWATAQELYRPPAVQPTPPPNAQPAPPPPPAGQGFRISRTIKDQTVRMIVRPSIGGPRARIKLANAFGTQPVRIGSASVALRQEGSAIVTGSNRPLTFGGQTSVVLIPGAVVLSDPVDLNVPAGRDLTVSLYLPEEAGRPTAHGTALHTTYISRTGDFTSAPTIDADTTTLSYYWLAAVDVAAGDDAGAVVGFGDSITDGTRSTPNADASWPSFLATRLATGPTAGKVSVANAGISGNQVLRDANGLAGVSALSRLDRDVLGQSGVKWVVVMEGINDIGTALRTGSTGTLTAEDVIWGHRQIIARAHARGVKAIGATLTPYEGAAYYSERGEAVRDAVNRWIRTSGEYDAVIDFDAAVRNPTNPRAIRPEFDPGDHLHPNDAGYRAMAEAVDLSIFR